MQKKRKDLIGELDFGELYKRQWAQSSFGPRNAADWDRRAGQRNDAYGKGDYDGAFLERMNLEGMETALDIGCGIGNLAVPLAQKLRRVYALDFSKEMLKYLRRNAREAGVRNVRTFQLSWTDSWARVPVADVAVCSRAMGVKDLRAALVKMTRHARRRCYATMNVGGSYLSEDLASLLKRRITARPDYIYAVNILYGMGFHAKVDFIRSQGGSSYGSEEEFVSSVAWRIADLSPREIGRLRRFYRELPCDADGRPHHRHDFEWAMLSWEKR